MDWNNETIIVSGASSGLGRSLAIEAGNRGAEVVLIGRDEKRLINSADKISNQTSYKHIFQCDFQDVRQVGNLYDEIKKKIKNIPTILINNAGYAVGGFVSNTPLEKYEKNFAVNLFAPIALIQCVLPDMINQKKGIIANVMGSAMYHSFPGMSSYCATKAALEAVHQSLTIELNGSPVKTIYINPGVFASNFNTNRDIGNRFHNFNYPSNTESSNPDIVALKVIDAIEKKKDKVIISSFMSNVGKLLNFFTPSIFEKLLVIRNQELLNSQSVIKVKNPNQ